MPVYFMDFIYFLISFTVNMHIYIRNHVGLHQLLYIGSVYLYGK